MAVVLFMNPEKDYINYSKEEFVNDEFFQNWVLGYPDRLADEFWTSFLNSYPEKKTEVEEAAGLLKAIPFKKKLHEGEPTDEEIRAHLAALQKELGFKRSKAKGATIISIRRLWWAAAIMTGLIFGGYFIFLNLNKPAEDQIASSSSRQQHDIAPGGNKAVLTLADGSQIILDSVAAGNISQQGNVTVIKLDDGELAYKSTAGKTAEMVYNTITTPRGGQYQLVLSDGTKVWLNAESSLRYPTAFVGNERKVTLTGEGYFEVAHDKTKPFYVSAGEMNVKVLGTHFNVNAYGDDGEIQTTLLEGSVEVRNQSNAVIIKPGQQAQMNMAGTTLKTVDGVDLDQVVAWKDGYFSFENASLKEIMQQLSRWYDVDVRYEGTVVPRKFGGSISRKSNLSGVMKILEESNVHFRVEGRKLIVLP